MISLDRVALSFGVQRILDDLTLHVPAGTITALLGSNGAGKSTTLSLLLGFARAERGEVRVCGIDPAADPDSVRRRIAYLPENVALYEHLSAVENADYLLALSGRRAAVARSSMPLPQPDSRNRHWISVSAASRRACGRRSRSRWRCCARCRCCCSTSRPPASIRAPPPTSTRCSRRCATVGPPY